MKKRITCFLLALLMVLSTVPAPSFAVDVETTSESGSVAGKLVKFTKSYPTLWTAPNGSQAFANASLMPSIMRIVAVETDNSNRTLYLLEAVEGIWDPIYDGYRYANSADMEFVDTEKPTDPTDPIEPTDPSDPSDPVDPELPTISGTVTDSEGNPVTDANGDPLIITVQGDLPEGAIVSASVPEIEGEKLPNVFDIKVLLPDGTEWQPIDDGKTVTVSIPVDTDAGYVDVIHFIDYAPAIHENVEYVSIDGADDALLNLVHNAIVASKLDGFVAVEAARSVKVEQGIVLIQTNSFSVYKWENSQFNEIPSTNNQTKEEFNNSWGNDGNNKITCEYYATKDHKFSLTTSTVVTKFDCAFSILDSVNVAEGSITGTFTTTVQGAYLTDTDGGLWDYHDATVVIPETAAPGETIVVRFKGASYTFYMLIHIVNLVDVTFDKNLDKAELTSTKYQGIVTDGDATKNVFTIPTSEDYIPTPTDSHYVFKGWNTSPDGTGTPYNYNKASNTFSPAAFTPMRDMTLYAMWESENSIVKFNANKGTGTYEDVSVTTGDSITLPAGPTRTNYVFLGWSASPDGYSTPYAAGSSYVVNQDTTLYAIWGVDLTINVSGGIELLLQKEDDFEAKPLEEHTYTNGQPVFIYEPTTSNGVTTYRTILLEGFLKNARFTFKYASNYKTNDPASTGAQINFTKQTNQVIADTTADGINVNTTISFSAVPQGQKSFIVSYNTNYGTPVASTVLQGLENDTLSLTTLPTKENTTRSGYTLEGWYLDSALTQKATVPMVISENITLYAKWTPNNYTAIWIVDGAVIEETEYAYGTQLVKPADPSKMGYSFAGWSSYTHGMTMPAGDVTFTAQWAPAEVNYTIETYTMALDGKYGVPVATIKKAYTEDVISITPVAPTGFSHDSTAANVLSAEVLPDGTTVLKVYYSRNTYDISFNTDDGNPVNSVEYYYGAPVTQLPISQKENHDFIGWAIDVNGTLVAVSDADGKVTVEGGYTMPAQNLELIAQWKLSVADYKTQIYVMDINGNYVLESEETDDDLIGESVSITPAAREGFTVAADSVLSVVVAADGSATLKVYYDRVTYTVTWIVDGEKTTKSYLFGAKIDKPDDPTKQGYDFAGWLGYTEYMTMPANNVTFTATWTPRTDTPYVVKHLLQNVTGDGYTVHETLNLTGETDSEITPKVNAYKGFTSPSETTVTIKADGTTVVEYKYDRIEYTVTYKADGDTVYTENVRYEGNVANVPQIPAKEGYTQTAPTWNHNGQNITGDTVITARYTINKYTITATMENGSISGRAVTYNHGTAANVTFTPNTGYKITGVTVNGVAQTNFTESSYVYNNASMDKNVEIEVTTVLKTYTIQFVNEDGTVLQSSEVTHGIKPEYTGATPTKASTAQYTYTFANWNPVIEVATGNKTYTATYTQTTNKYTITWVDGNGKVIGTATMDYGTTPAYTGVTPTKTATAQYTYTFNNTWSPAIEQVTGDATYTAQFDSSVNKYTVTWVDEDGTQLKVENNVSYGTTPSAPADPTKAATAQHTYTFAGWTPAVSEVTGNVTYTATYSATVNEYTITWVGGDGNVLKTEQVAYGETPVYTGSTPTKAATAQYTYTFNGTWTPELVSVTGDAAYTAQFSSTVNTYTVTWKNYDGTVLETDVNVPYGTQVSYDGTEPKRASDAEWNYLFAGWNPQASNYTVAGDVVFTAQYNSVKQEYDVTWYNKGKADLLYTSENVKYGDTPEYRGALPTWTPNDGYTYTFEKWSPVVSPVIGNASYEAEYTCVLNQYDIIYHLNGGTAFNETSYTVESAAITLINPTREGYTFAGWSGTDIQGTSMTVTIPKGSIGNREYTANWTVIEYNISYNLNGGTVAGENPVKYTVETDTFTLVNPTKPGYTFVGWTGTDLNGKTMTVVIERGGMGDRVYTANWTANAYTVAFAANGGSGEMAALEMTYDASKNLTPNAFTRTGYHFVGWNTAENGSGTSYSDGEEVSNLVTANGGRITLYAQWEIRTVSLTITTNNAIDTNQSYIFTVTGNTVDGRSVSLTVALGANDRQRIVNLPAGVYTIQDHQTWSWRYASQSITHDIYSDTVVDFNYTYSQMLPERIYWLNSYGNEKLKDDPARRKK